MRNVVQRLALATLIAVVTIGDPDAALWPIATRDIAHAEYFALGGVGVGGETAPGELALRAILSEPSAEERLLDLLPNASPSGRLYVLAGLARLGSRTRDNIEAFLLRDPSPVEIRSGCRFETTTVAAVTQTMDTWRLERLDVPGTN